MYSEKGTAVFSNDLFETHLVPTFLQWNGNTLNTPFKVGLTDCQEGFAFVSGQWDGYMTVTAFAKNSTSMWVWSKPVNKWEEYSKKSDLANYLLKSTFTSQISGNLKIEGADDRSSTEILAALPDKTLYCCMSNGGAGISSELGNMQSSNAYLVFIYKSAVWRHAALAIPMDGISTSNTAKLYVGQCNGETTVKWKSIS